MSISKRKSRIREIIDQWRTDPLINMAEEAKQHNMNLVYPMLVIFDDKMTEYDNLIMDIISYIQTKYNAVQPTLTIPYTIFFCFFMWIIVVLLRHKFCNG